MAISTREKKGVYENQLAKTKDNLTVKTVRCCPKIELECLTIHISTGCNHCDASDNAKLKFVGTGKCIYFFLHRIAQTDSVELRERTVERLYKKNSLEQDCQY